MLHNNSAETRLGNLKICFTVITETLEVLVQTVDAPFMKTIYLTTQSISQMIQNIKQNKQDCAELLEQVYSLLNSIVTVFLESETGCNLPLRTLDNIGQFARTLHNIHDYIKGRQEGYRIKNLFRQTYHAFHINSTDFLNEIAQMKQGVEEQHQQVLSFISELSEDSSHGYESSLRTALNNWHCLLPFGVQNDRPIGSGDQM
ncbi:hypothetical protein MSAN_01299800 [Mycena sanguinolenta]|uniref:Uncharacterized protein n=1 Tax=Mycena sanguinolenta TaxID=230812 RepID=A0A8H6YE63_9AGAR|nr:hypothetical protein MSAN_01299800 [Mycena sanguinolenta]